MKCDRCHTLLDVDYVGWADAEERGVEGLVSREPNYLCRKCRREATNHSKEPVHAEETAREQASPKPVAVQMASAVLGAAFVWIVILVALALFVIAIGR